MAKRINPNLVKIHRSYSVEEVADVFGVHKNTVRQWIKRGLQVCDEKKPALILGSVLRDYLKQQNQQRKRSCRADEIYCMKCKLPRVPINRQVEFVVDQGSSGCLVGICPSCNSRIFRFSNESKLDVLGRVLEIAYREHKNT